MKSKNDLLSDDNVINVHVADSKNGNSSMTHYDRNLLN